MNVIQRYSYLAAVVAGWVLFLLCFLSNSLYAFWIGGVGGILLAGAGIVMSISRFARTTEDLIVHGVAWTLAISLGLLSFLWMYTVMSGV